MKKFRFGMAFQGLLVTLGIWTVLVVLVYFLGAIWPHATVNPASCFAEKPYNYSLDNCIPVSRSEAWFNFSLFVLAVEFLWLKAWMMTRMTRVLDTLGASLISVNIMFSILYLYGMLSLLFPHLVVSLIPLYILRGGVVIILGWGIVELLKVEDPDPPYARWENT